MKDLGVGTSQPCLAEAIGEAGDAGQHTPGPWVYYGGFLCCVPPNGVPVPMFELDGHCECGDRLNPVTGTDEECAANGRLMARAPGLYAACQALVDSVVERGDLGNVYALGRLHAAVDLARAALGKPA